MEKQKLRDTLATFDQAQGSITLADAMTPEMPLVYTNKGFEIISGYNRNEIIGKNCRILQGHMRDQSGIQTIHEAIAKKQVVL